jgi:chromosome segregation ATPase
MNDVHCAAEKELLVAVAELKTEIRNLKDEVRSLHRDVDVLSRQASRWKGGLGLLLILGGLVTGILGALGWLIKGH